MVSRSIFLPGGCLRDVGNAGVKFARTAGQNGDVAGLPETIGQFYSGCILTVLENPHGNFG
jgi:hypothetical protein